MGEQCNNNGRKIHGDFGDFGQTQGRSELGHQTKNAYGGKRDDHGDQAHHNVIQIHEKRAQLLTAGAGLTQCQPEQQSKQNHLQHFTVGHGSDGIARHDIDEGVFHARGGFRLEGGRSLRLIGALATQTRICSERNEHGHGHCDGSGEQIQANGFTAEPTHAASITQACGAAD